MNADPKPDPEQVGARARRGHVALATALAWGPTGAGAGVEAPKPIKSGAGPGWPQTLHPTDFVARVDNPWFPLEPGSRWHYRGVEEARPIHRQDARDAQDQDDPGRAGYRRP